MSRQYNIEGGQTVKLSLHEFAICYRAQYYAPDLNESKAHDKKAWAHYNFTASPERRFVPEGLNVATYYFGFDPLAVFVEFDKTFREKSLNHRRPLKFSEQELSAVEIISFKLHSDLKLFDLCSPFALSRHNLKVDDAILCSTDYRQSHDFAKQVYLAGYEGILFRTRQGIPNAAVVFENAESKIKAATVIERKSALTIIRSNLTAEQDLGIKITAYI